MIKIINNLGVFTKKIVLLIRDCFLNVRDKKIQVYKMYKKLYDTAINSMERKQEFNIFGDDYHKIEIDIGIYYDKFVKEMFCKIMVYLNNTAEIYACDLNGSYYHNCITYIAELNLMLENLMLNEIKLQNNVSNNETIYKKYQELCDNLNKIFD